MSKQGKAVVENVGQDVNSGQTVVFCVGISSEIADSRFAIRIPESETQYTFYSTDVAKRLKGKTVVFQYDGVNDLRIPLNIVFESVVE